MAHNKQKLNQISRIKTRKVNKFCNAFHQVILISLANNTNSSSCSLANTSGIASVFVRVFESYLNFCRVRNSFRTFSG